MNDRTTPAPDSTAVRVALWRAMHLQVDPPPHVIEDEIGLHLATPDEMLRLAREAGFKEVQHVSAAALGERYFAGRTDGLRPPNNTEELLVATT
jgi:O-methyltransferase involved in polyketide biosynthesis